MNILHTTLVCLAIATGTVNSSTFSNLKAMCKKNSDPEAYENLVNGFSEFNSCVDNVSDFFTNIEKMDTAKNAASSLKTLCNDLPELQKCEQMFTPLLKECLDNGEQYVYTLGLNTTMAFAEFVCEENAKRITDFFNKDEVKCEFKKTPAHEKCLNTLKEKKIFNLNYSSDKPFTLTELFKTFSFNQEQCDGLHEFRSCVVEDMKQCSQSLADKYDILFELGLRLTACSNCKTTTNDNKTTNGNKSTASGMGGASAIVCILLTFIHGIYVYI